MTVDTGRLSCGFDSGTASDGTLNIRMLCTDPGKKSNRRSMVPSSSYDLAKKIELIIEPMRCRATRLPGVSTQGICISQVSAPHYHVSPCLS